MDLGIKGRRAIVTGGSSGIGFETARQFLEESVRVLITGRNEKKLTAARDDLAKRTGGEVHAIVADMTKQADIDKMVAKAKEKLGSVDILVNNAGQMYSGRFAAIRPTTSRLRVAPWTLPTSTKSGAAASISASACGKLSAHSAASGRRLSTTGVTA